MRRRTWLQAAAGTLAIGGLAAHLARRRRLIRQVSPPLRTPLLYLPMTVRSDLMLRVGRPVVVRVRRPEPGIEVQAVRVPGLPRRPEVPAFTYAPAERGSGALIWLHGGGRIAGAPQSAHRLCSLMAKRAGVLVVNVDYRLAPEHPFPAALDDCAAVLSWLREQSDTLAIDPARIAVGGASAGGGLAAELAQRALDGGFPPAFQLLLYPMLDDRVRHARGSRLGWTPGANAFAWSRYLGHPAGADEARPYAVAARREDLSGLPPAWITVGSLDLYLDECAAYARRLEEAGVACELVVVPGMYHGADLITDGRPEPADRLWRTAAAAVRAVIGPHE